MSQTVSSPLPEPMTFAEELALFPIFKGIPLSDLQRLNVRKPRPIRRGTTIFRQGDIVPYIYLVEKGEIELVRKDPSGKILRRIVRPGQVLGRLELDSPEGQLGTAKTLSTVQLILVDIPSLDRLRAQYPSLKSHFDRSDVIGHLRANPYFAVLSDLEIKWISDIIEVDEAEPGEIIYKNGDEAKEIIIVRQGRVKLESNKNQRWVSAGAVIGYKAVLAKTNYLHTAIVENKTAYFRLPGDDFLAVARLYPDHDWSSAPIPVESLLRRAPIFSNFTEEDIKRLAGFVMQVHYHLPHQTIVRAGKDDFYYYILARGSALLQMVDDQNEVISSSAIGRGASFGEGPLLFGDPSEVTVETMEPTDWVRIHRLDFQLFLEENPECRERLTLPPHLDHRLRTRVYLGDWQREDEEIISINRRHWIVLVKRMLIVAIVVAIQFIIATAFRFLTHTWHLGLNLLIMALYAVPWSIWILLDYLNDFHIVTTQRVIHQEKVILLKERRTSAPIDQIQNVDIERDFLARIFRYGHLVISTAATAGQIVFDHHPDPNRAYDVIVKEMTRVEKFGLSDRQEEIKRELQERLHLRLEERVDERALMESSTLRHIKNPRNLPLIRMLGLQQESGNRLVWRKHWFGLIRATFVPFLIVLLGLVLLFFSAINFLKLDFWPQVISIFITGLLTLAAFLWLWWNWEDWANDRYIVSDQLIERIIKKPLWFDEDRITLSLERVQNVEFNRPSPLAFLLNYGDVRIQTAASDGEVVFSFVPAPDEVQFEIFHRIKEYQENVEKRRQSEQKNDFVEWLEAYHKLVVQSRDR